jgi:serine/threonine protein kinase/tetratricopeptide (TPR) repeat protein
MNADHDRAKSLFLNAVEIASLAEREAYLDAACKGDVALRREVEELLQHHEPARDFLEPPAPAPAAALGQPGQETAGAVIGPYKLLEPVGEGGMGTVWLARQQEPVKRLVAVKLIKAGMDSKQVLARFDAERQALALMDHPNIARVLDADTTDAGRPYFVMELVKGTPITTYCDDKHLTVRERLELFGDVCRAVQHAHQKGIIHRDLKPSNILVAPFDGKPVVKVIDFGVAKATGQRLTDATLVTGFGAVVGTPEYMSPEQAETNNQDIDTRSDIYALGVLLYELLTGSTPLTKKRVKEAALLEVLRVIREEEPPRPSTRLSSTNELPAISARRQTEPTKLTKLVRGELDWIVMKALEKDRDRRYESANDLATDVHRYLADEPVAACPPSARYRLRKFVRRNRGLVAAAAVVVCVLLAGIVGTTWGLVWANQAREEEARQRALAEQSETKALAAGAKEREAKLTTQGERDKAAGARDRAREVLDDMTSKLTSDSLAAQAALGVEQKQFLTRVVRYYRELAGEETDSEASRVRAAGAAFRVGVIEARLGRADEAEQAFRQALTELAALAAAFPDSHKYRDALARCQRNLAWHLNRSGRSTEAEGLFRAALASFEKLATDFPAVPGYRQALAINQSELGVLLADLGLHEKSRAVHREAVVLLEKLAAECPDEPEYRLELSVSLDGLGKAAHALDKCAEAEKTFRAALDIRERLAADFPAEFTYRQQIGVSHINLGVVLSRLQRHAEAERAYRAALAIRQELVTRFPGAADHRHELANARHNLGSALHEQGKVAAAEVEYRAALQLRQQVVADLPGNLPHAAGLGSTFTKLAGLCRDSGRLAEALELYHQAITTLTAVVNREPRRVGARESLRNGHMGLALCLGKLERFTDALAEWDRALALAEGAARVEVTIERALCLARVAPAKAVAVAEQLLEAGKPRGDDYFNAACIRAQAARGTDEARELHGRRAVELLRQALAAFKNTRFTLPDGTTEVGFKTRLGRLRQDPALDPLRQRQDFQELLAEAVAAQQGAIHRAAARAYNRGNDLRMADKVDEAITAYREALAIDPDYPEAHCNLGGSLRDLGQFTEALASFKKGHELGTKRANWAYPSARWVADCERLIRCEARLQAVLEGTEKSEPAEQLVFARLCMLKRMPEAAARFFRAVLELPPEQMGGYLAAAQAAALAGSGKREPAAALDDTLRARLRQQALAWLRVVLRQQEKNLQAGTPQAQKVVPLALASWKIDVHFAGVRGAAALAQLPPGERAAWAQFWAEVDTLLEKARKPQT